MVNAEHGMINTTTNTGSNINLKSKDELAALVNEYKSLIPPHLNLRNPSDPAPSATAVNDNAHQLNLSGGGNAQSIF